MKNGSVLKVLGVVAFILCFIGGIVYGSAFRARPDQFNWALMFGVWFAGALSCALIYGIGTIIEHLERISYFEEKAYYHRQEEKERTPSNAPAQAKGNAWTCPNCQTVNGNEKLFCAKCGTLKK